MGSAIDLVALINQRLVEKSVSAAAASRLACGHSWLVYNLRKGVTPKYDTLKALCDVLDIEFYIGSSRRDSPGAFSLQITDALGLSPAATEDDVLEKIKSLSENEPTMVQLRNEMTRFQVVLGETLSRIPEPPKVIEFPSGQGKAIAVRELRTAAGAGAFELDESITGYVYFRTSWLRKHHLRPERCCIIGVTGDSMEPALFDGSSILLDRDRREARDGGVFVVRALDGLIVKRAARGEDGAWVLASDNPEWQSMPWPEGADIVGQVAWTARTLLS